MGHDITAKRPNVDMDALAHEFRLNDTGEGWRSRYRQFCECTEVASNRRAAGNPLNQVLYLALGVMDEAYAGYSGNGIELGITIEQFRSAKEVLETKSFADMSRERNMVDNLVELFSSAGMEVSGTFDVGDGDVSQEQEFIEKCIAFCENEGINELTVSFC